MIDDVESVTRALYKFQNSKDDLDRVIEYLNSYEISLKNNLKSSEVDFILSAIRESKQYVLKIKSCIENDCTNVRKVLKSIQ